jgi:hypothetical protein
MTDSKPSAPVPLHSTPEVPGHVPQPGFDTAELVTEIAVLLEIARGQPENLGAVNWSRVRVADIEFRVSLLHPEQAPCYVVTIDEASPEAALGPWLTARIDQQQFPNTRVECEW